MPFESAFIIYTCAMCKIEYKQKVKDEAELRFYLLPEVICQACTRLSLWAEE